MGSSSIKFRLLFAGAIAIGLALLAAGLGIEGLFERHVKRQAGDRLRTDLNVLLAAFNVDPDGQLTLKRLPSNPRYGQPFSGLYWQVMRDGAVLEKSRSLWDERLATSDKRNPAAGYETRNFAGPDGQSLLAVQRAIVVKRGAKSFTFQAAAALDLSELKGAVKDFRFELAWGMAVLASVLLASLWVALNVGLRPLAHLRRDLAQLRSGETSRLVGTYPSEVRLLVSDFNEVLEHQEAMIERAKLRAGNLAHGLKTPLTAISTMSDELAESELREFSVELGAHVSTIERHLERELALARSVQGRTLAKPVNVRKFIGRLVQTMQRLPGGNDLNWLVNIDEALSLGIDETTFGEIVGNLLDNARKWADASVAICASIEGERFFMEVSDDGPGVPKCERERITQPGQRLDETASGSGLGLSIIADIVAHLGGSLELAQSERDGLSARVTLPLDVGRRAVPVS